MAESNTPLSESLRVRVPLCLPSFPFFSPLFPFFSPLFPFFFRCYPKIRPTVIVK